MSESPDHLSPLEEFEAYYSTLPAAFKERLHFGQKGIPGDFVNNYAGIHTHIAAMMEDAVEGGDGELQVLPEDIVTLNHYIGLMISYRVYLERIIGRVLEKNPDIRINTKELIGKLMDVPGVLEMEANIAEIKAMRLQDGPDFFRELERLKFLIGQGVAIIRDQAVIAQIKKMFPHVAR